MLWFNKRRSSDESSTLRLEIRSTVSIYILIPTPRLRAWHPTASDDINLFLYLVELIEKIKELEAENVVGMRVKELVVTAHRR